MAYISNILIKSKTFSKYRSFHIFILSNLLEPVDVDISKNIIQQISSNNCPLFKQQIPLGFKLWTMHSIGKDTLSYLGRRTHHVPFLRWRLETDRAQVKYKADIREVSQMKIELIFGVRIKFSKYLRVIPKFN